MSSPPNPVIVTCLQCGNSYPAWHRTSINLASGHLASEKLDAATSSYCPHCGCKAMLDTPGGRPDSQWQLAPVGACEPTPLSTARLGRCAELSVKMELLSYGFSIYSPEVDDCGLDCLIRHDDGTFTDIQVKALRKSTYVFFRARSFEPRVNLYIALVLYDASTSPLHYLIPTLVDGQPHPLLVYRPYKDLKSKPEWGITLTKNTRETLCHHALANEVARLAALHPRKLASLPVAAT